MFRSFALHFAQTHHMCSISLCISLTVHSMNPFSIFFIVYLWINTLIKATRYPFNRNEIKCALISYGQCSIRHHTSTLFLIVMHQQSRNKALFIKLKKPKNQNFFLSLFFFYSFNQKSSGTSYCFIGVIGLFCSHVYWIVTRNERRRNYIGRCTRWTITNSRSILLYGNDWIAWRQCWNVIGNGLFATIDARRECLLQFLGQTTTSVELFGLCIVCWATKLSHIIWIVDVVHMPTFYASL